MIKAGYLDNCYINGKRILPRNEIEQKKEQLKTKYLNYKNNYTLMLKKALEPYQEKADS